MLKTGLYEQIINKKINSEINTLDTDKYLVKQTNVNKAEASKILSDYVAKVVQKGLDNISDKSNNALMDQIALVNDIINIIQNKTEENDFTELAVDNRAEQLMALIDKQNTTYAISEDTEVVRPVTSLANSSLFTGAIREPQMLSELKKEIPHSNRIDMLVSFIKWSGLRLLIDELKSFTSKGGRLRVITTSYMGATDVKAIEELSKLANTEIKVSYDVKRTRLHAKSYIFTRDTGFTTAYVGSSNLSNVAISSGLEWNVKVTQQDLQETIEKIQATFESYWNSKEFEVYEPDSYTKLAKALKSERYNGDSEGIRYYFDINPYPFQQEILDKLQADRKIHNSYRNLVVAATGTGKTVISAFDYKKFCAENGQRHRLLFVAHREEILKQSLYCFRNILRNPNFGELFDGNYRPEEVDYLFASIQTLNSQEWFKKTSPDFYDYIVVDEFHHAAAPSYQKLLNYYKPKVLLGLTATPERMDGEDILKYFDNHIAAEIRLPEAIDRKLLCPFQYFGVSDTVDLDEIKWTRGGYDKTELSKAYTENIEVAEKRVSNILESIEKYVTDLDDVKGLGFCVSQEHAKFMEEAFNKCGVKALALTSNSSREERLQGKQRLIEGKIKFIFVVDLYNEGVDIPEVNTILFLRPTESLTIFLQQLGRGLRLSEGKECLTVLDFIGQANRKYSFENKFKALLNYTNKGIKREIEQGFTSLPKGCYIQLEKKAKENILQNINSIVSGTRGLITRIKDFNDDKLESTDLNLRNFVEYSGMSVKEVYAKNIKQSFSRLCVEAQLKEDFQESTEELMTKAFKNICRIDSRRWIEFLLNFFAKLDDNTVLTEFDETEIDMLQMLHFTIWQKSYDKCNFSNLLEGFKLLKKDNNMYNELLEILRYNLETIDFVDENVELGFKCPLDLHCQYSRDQIFVALGYLNPSVIRQGVKWLEDKKVDVFINTLNKADKDYSPTTMYKDYSVNETLFHWQSQSTTSESSNTGQRYINHAKLGSKVLLFVREYNEDINGTALFTYLGTANYVKHEGSRPMNIIWRLDRPIPAKFLKKTNKLLF